MVTSHAVATPTNMTPIPTPMASPAVLRMYSGSTVATRCAQVPPLGTKRLLGDVEHRHGEHRGQPERYPGKGSDSRQPQPGFEGAIGSGVEATGTGVTPAA